MACIGTNGTCRYPPFDLSATGATGHAIINTNERLYRAGDDTINSMPPLSPIFGGGLYHTAHLGYWAVGAGHGVAAICVD
jgi:hypothetical protein